MTRNVKVSLGNSELANEITKALEDTRKLTEDALIKSVDKTAREIVKRTKSAAPTRTGKYRAGWGSKVAKKGGRGGYGRIVHNRSRYMLTHLLQKGHGGPHPAKAYPHIPSDAETEVLFEKNMKREMSKK